MKKNSVLLIVWLIFGTLNAQEVQVTSGRLKRFPSFQSLWVDARNIDVWLPNDYSNKEKYAVLYLHDGQMLYDSRTTWNKQSWEADSIAGRLIDENKIRKFIIVGIWNNDKKRHPEYFPQKPFASLSPTEKAFVTAALQKSGRTTDVFSPISDAYLKFIVEELKPFIDTNFSTSKESKSTFIGGSSMGGLISLYAICEYPKVFGGAICISTHWPGIFSVENNPIPSAFFKYLKNSLPNPKNHLLYFDYGDQTLDALYSPFQEKVDLIVNEKGFTKKNWKTQFFPGKDHSEKSWKERLDIPLLFMLKK